MFPARTAKQTFRPSNDAAHICPSPVSSLLASRQPDTRSVFAKEVGSARIPGKSFTSCILKVGNCVQRPSYGMGYRGTVVPFPKQARDFSRLA